MDNDNKIVKYKGITRKCAINILAWLENNPNPAIEDLDFLQITLRGRLKNSVTDYCENIRQGGWEKHTTTLKLDESKLLEQKKFLQENQGIVNDEYIEGSGN